MHSTSPCFFHVMSPFLHGPVPLLLSLSSETTFCLLLAEHIMKSVYGEADSVLAHNVGSDTRSSAQTALG